MQLYGRRLAEELEQRSSAWSKATEVRNFLSAYDRAFPKEKRSRTAEAWFEAALAFADRLDPLSKPRRRWHEISNPRTKC